MFRLTLDGVWAAVRQRRVLRPEGKPAMVTGSLRAWKGIAGRLLARADVLASYDAAIASTENASEREFLERNCSKLASP